jgi:hypothetical protein
MRSTYLLTLLILDMTNLSGVSRTSKGGEVEGPHNCPPSEGITIYCVVVTSPRGNFRLNYRPRWVKDLKLILLRSMLLTDSTLRATLSTMTHHYHPTSPLRRPRGDLLLALGTLKWSKQLINTP